MPKRQVFYSFHFDKDVMRVQQVRNMGSLEANTPVSPQDWETVKRGGDRAIEKWIDENMKNRSCVIVLIGQDTSKRPWVKYEIEKAWKEKRAVLGIHIHNVKCPNKGIADKGKNPFENYTFKNSRGNIVSIPCKDPKAGDAYNDIKNNIEKWIEEAIAIT
jgi:hypothetical protein